MSSNKPSSSEVHPGPGFRVCNTYPQCNPASIEAIRQFDVPDISDALNRLYALDTGIKCMNATPRAISGNVCTVRVFPGDNLMVHKALDIARAGDIIAIDGNGERSTNAILGDLICTKAQHLGIGGFIVDGLVRDMPGINEIGFPVFARGTTAVGPLHRGPGEINFPISCGGVVVNPGDVMVADEAGIVVIPLPHLDLILARLAANRSRMEQYLAAVRKGEFSNDWVDKLLQDSGCPEDNA